MEKTGFYSWKKGSLAKGCRLCVRGRKLVLFVTGICSKNCWYCPLSEAKKNKDVVFANEWKISKQSEIIKEAELCDARGAGITGGDPFLRAERAARFIRMLKKRFGRKFHIHLYAPLNNITLPKLRMIYGAGLDEIRIHPDFYSKKDWGKIKEIAKFGWDVGVEIPAIPGTEKNTISLIDYFIPYIKFLNINELEQSDTNASAMLKRGLRVRGILDYSVKGSQEMAFMLMKKYAGKKIGIHYCTTRLKDAVQLAARIKRRARNAAEKFDKVTGEGMLVRGAIYLPELKPSFGYRKMLDNIKGSKRKNIILKLNRIMRQLKNKYKISSKLIKVDRLKLRILTSDKIAEKIKENGLVKAVVVEYPTWDATEIDMRFI